jgi:hypothetical protein
MSSDETETIRETINSHYAEIARATLAGIQRGRRKETAVLPQVAVTLSPRMPPHSPRALAMLPQTSAPSLKAPIWVSPAEIRPLSPHSDLAKSSST